VKRLDREISFNCALKVRQNLRASSTRSFFPNLDPEATFLWLPSPRRSAANVACQLRTEGAPGLTTDTVRRSQFRFLSRKQCIPLEMSFGGGALPVSKHIA